MRRALAGFFAVTTILAVVHGEDAPSALHFSGEPIGSEYPLAHGIAADAADLLAADKSLSPPDAEASALQKGQLVRAYAEALRTEDSNDTDLAAQSQARRALILARLGAVNFAAELANEALTNNTVRGEVALARAWMLWHAGDLVGADREAARATGSPAWALAEWKAHRAKFAPALARFQAAQEPEDPYSTDFLAYTELAAAAHAYYLADGLYFRAVNNLQQQFNYEKNFPPANLQRARRGFRDLVHSILGAAAREPGAERLAALLLATAREVCATPATRADWEIYFALVEGIHTTQTKFDFAFYDLHGDLVRAEKEAGLDLTWREKLKPLLTNPRLRFASRVHQTLARLEAHEGAALLNEPLETEFSPAQLDTLQAYSDLVATEDAVLASLHQALPADRDAVPRDREYVVAVAKLRFRRALLARDFDAAREQLAKLEQFPNTDPAISLDTYRARITALEQGPFLTAYAQLLRYPPTDVPEKHLEAALAAARGIEAQLTERHGDGYLSKPDLPAADIVLIQQLHHVALIVTLSSSNNIFAAERALADLQRWCDPKKHPAFEPLAGLIATVANLPAQDESFQPEEKKMWDVLVTGRGDPTHPARFRQLMRDDPDRWTPHMLLPIAYWRLSRDDLALESIAETRKRVRVNKATLAVLDTLINNNDTVIYLRRIVSALQKAPAAERTAKAAEVIKSTNIVLQGLSHAYCADQPVEFSKLTAPAQRIYAFSIAALIHARLAQMQLREAALLFEVLETIHDSESIAFTQPAIERFAFTNDLPDEAARATWRRLLSNDTMSVEQIKAAFAQMKTISEKGCFSAELSAVLLPYRARDFKQARENLARLQRVFGRFRAIAAQLSEVDTLLTTTGEVFTIDFSESTESLASRRSNLHLQASNYRSSNYTALADAYQNNLYTPERRYLEDLCRDIDALSAQISAIEARNSAKQDADRRHDDTIRANIYARLRRLMAL